MYKARKNLMGSAWWLSEDLTGRDQQIAYVARKAKKDKKIHNTWSLGGDIYIQARKDDKPLKISSVCDLDEFLKRNEQQPITEEDANGRESDDQNEPISAGDTE